MRSGGAGEPNAVADLHCGGRELRHHQAEGEGRAGHQSGWENHAPLDGGPADSRMGSAGGERVGTVPQAAVLAQIEGCGPVDKLQRHAVEEDPARRHVRSGRIVRPVDSGAARQRMLLGAALPRATAVTKADDESPALRRRQRGREHPFTGQDLMETRIAKRARGREGKGSAEQRRDLSTGFRARRQSARSGRRGGCAGRGQQHHDERPDNPGQPILLLL